MLFNCFGVVDCHTAPNLVYDVASRMLISGETQFCWQCAAVSHEVMPTLQLFLSS